MNIKGFGTIDSVTSDSEHYAALAKQLENFAEEFRQEKSINERETINMGGVLNWAFDKLKASALSRRKKGLPPLVSSFEMDKQLRSIRDSTGEIVADLPIGDTPQPSLGLRIIPSKDVRVTTDLRRREEWGTLLTQDTGDVVLLQCISHQQSILVPAVSDMLSTAASFIQNRAKPGDIRYSYSRLVKKPTELVISIVRLGVAVPKPSAFIEDLANILMKRWKTIRPDR